jgi:hypothetical protein
MMPTCNLIVGFEIARERTGVALLPLFACGERVLKYAPQDPSHVLENSRVDRILLRH